MVCDYAGNNNSFNDVCDGGWQTMQITELISFLKILGKFWSDKRQEKKIESWPHDPRNIVHNKQTKVLEYQLKDSHPLNLLMEFGDTSRHCHLVDEYLYSPHLITWQCIVNVMRN